VSPVEPEDGGRAADRAGRPDTFEEIVAGWVAEGTVPSWPGKVEPAAPSPTGTDAVTRPVPPPTPDFEDPADEEHFIPPDPPPIPRIGVTAAIGLALLGLGVVLLAVPTLLGSHADLGLPLGLVSLALGLGWLVLRAWPTSRDDDRDGGGAVL
jgi:hypothetical protein